MTTLEATHLLPWEARAFNAKRDIKEGKTLVILQEGSQFEIGTTYVKVGKSTEWKENTFRLVLRPGDEITLHESDSKEFIEVDYQPISGKDKPKRFRVTRDIFENVLEDLEIAVLKERKLQETKDVTASSVKDILAKVQLGFSFSAKKKVKEDMVFGEHGIKKWDEIVIHSRDHEMVGLIVFEGEAKFSKKGDLETGFREVSMSVADFERLIAVDGVTNFRKKALALLEKTK